MPKELAIVGDKVFYLAMKGAGMVPAKLDHQTVNYHCLWPAMYRMAGEAPPAEAKADIDASFIDPWLRQQTPRALEIISRRCGVRFVAGS
jgi:hypothetical protein